MNISHMKMIKEFETVMCHGLSHIVSISNGHVILGGLTCLCVTKFDLIFKFYMILMS
jgi:hypothetical protein